MTTALVGYEAGAGKENIPVARFFVHPSYDPTTGGYDAMIVKLQTSSTLDYATLNRNTTYPVPYTATEVEALGVGTGTTLQSAKLIHIDPNLCFAYLQAGGATGWYNKQLPDDYLCITDYSTKGQCTGDKGGPMVIVGDNLADDRVVAIMSRYVTVPP